MIGALDKDITEDRNMIISAAACGHCGQSLATVEREASGPGWRMQQCDWLGAVTDGC